MRVQPTMNPEEEAAWRDEMRLAEPVNPEDLARYRRGRQLDTVMAEPTTRYPVKVTRHRVTPR